MQLLTLMGRRITHDAAGRYSRMVESLRLNNVRITPQRLAVIKVLSECEGHPSVEQIHEKVKTTFPTTSIATVYKAVALLKTLNEVLEIRLPGGCSHYDGISSKPHPHLVCVNCGDIVDPPPQNLSGLIRMVSAQTGYRVIGHQICLYGICPECRQDD